MSKNDWLGDVQKVRLLEERIMDARNNMKLIRQRNGISSQKMDVTRIALCEEHIGFLAEAFDLLLEIKQRGL